MLGRVVHVILGSTRMYLQQSAPTAQQARVIMIRRLLHLAQLVCQVSTQSLDLLDRAMDVPLAELVQYLADKAWMHAMLATQAHTRVKGRRRARSVQEVLRMRTMTHRQTAQHVQ